MPYVGSFIFIIGFVTWWLGNLTWTIFIALLIIYYLFDVVLQRMIHGIGFVSKEKYKEAIADRDKYKELHENTSEEYEELKKEILNLLGDHKNTDSLLRAKQIEGQDVVFYHYVNDQAKFQHHLNLYVGRMAEKEQAKRKHYENTQKHYRRRTNQKGQSVEDMWHTVLGVTRITDYETTKQAYRNLSKRYHPDRPDGDAEKMKKINAAWAEAEKHFGKA